MLAIDVFGLDHREFGLSRGLGQELAPPAIPATPVPNTIPPRGTSTVILPALPDNVAVRCKFDDGIGAWRCEHGGLFERPSTFVIIFGGLTLVAFGYFLGRTQLLGQLTRLVAAGASRSPIAALATQREKK